MEAGTVVAEGAGPEKGLEALNRAAVERIAADEPDWLREARLAAWDVYEATPMPTTKLEEWRYTDVSKLGLDEVSFEAVDGGAAGAGATGAGAKGAGAKREGAAGDAATGDGATRAPEGDPDGPSTNGNAPPTGPPATIPDGLAAGARALLEHGAAAAGRMLQVGGRMVYAALEPEYADKGVILTDLATAAREHPELVREHLGGAVGPEAGKFQALNGALWTAGVFLYVPKGVQLEHPIRVGRWIDEAGRAFFPRTLIVAGEGSRVAYIDDLGSPDFDEPALSLGAVEVFAGQGAQVQHVGLQRWGRGVRHVSQQRTIAQRDANLDTLVVNLGASVARIDMAASLQGPGARSDMLGLYFAHDDQHFDHNTRQDHVSDHATSDLLYKGALYDKTRAVFRGIIKVFPGAQRTDAYHTNRNLLLSGKARADSLPNLEIEADDVRCSHGATVGQLDAEEMFYLRSRGMSKEDAERLVVFGFFGEVLERLPLPEVVEELREAVSEKIRWHHA
jgi:Fe-S cluster assembly protein SufD